MKEKLFGKAIKSLWLIDYNSNFQVSQVLQVLLFLGCCEHFSTGHFLVYAPGSSYPIPDFLPGHFKGSKQAAL